MLYQKTEEKRTFQNNSKSIGGIESKLVPKIRKKIDKKILYHKTKLCKNFLQNKIENDFFSKL